MVSFRARQALGTGSDHIPTNPNASPGLTRNAGPRPESVSKALAATNISLTSFVQTDRHGAQYPFSRCPALACCKRNRRLFRRWRFPPPAKAGRSGPSLRHDEHPMRWNFRRFDETCLSLRRRHIVVSTGTPSGAATAWLCKPAWLGDGKGTKRPDREATFWKTAVVNPNLSTAPWLPPGRVDRSYRVVSHKQIGPLRLDPAIHQLKNFYEAGLDAGSARHDM